MLDTIYRCETPEGIALEAELAGPLVRILAYLIDGFINFCLLIALSIIATIFGKTGGGLFLISFFLLFWFYPVFFELAWKGQTPGKKALKIRVVHDNLTPLTFGSSLTRNLLRVADSLPFFYTFGLISLLINKHFKRLGDIAAGTIVVHDHSETKRPSSNDQGQEAQASPFPLSQEEQLAIVDFGDRQGTFSVDRQQELAAILSSVFGMNAEMTRKRLLAIAAWLSGK